MIDGVKKGAREAWTFIIITFWSSIIFVIIVAVIMAAFTLGIYLSKL